MINGSDERLIEALKKVDVHRDVAPPDVHDPMTMLLRENAIQAHLMRWDDARDRYVLTGAGRRRIIVGSRAPGVNLDAQVRKASAWPLRLYKTTSTPTTSNLRR